MAKKKPEATTPEDEKRDVLQIRLAPEDRANLDDIMVRYRLDQTHVIRFALALLATQPVIVTAPPKPRKKSGEIRE